MTDNKTGPVSLAYYVTSTLKAAPSLREWERMHISLSDWMSNEVEELDRIIAYHNENDQPKKAYKSRIRQQNFIASIEFLSKIFQQLLSIQHQSQLASHAASEETLNMKKHAAFFHENWVSAMGEMELMTQIAISAMEQSYQYTDAEFLERVKHQLQIDPLFRKGVQVLVANGINEL